jgi:hypothetical protein
VNKPLHPHTSAFLRELLEAGADLRTIQLLLGHADLRETMIYIHLSKSHVGATASPLDGLSLGREIDVAATARGGRSDPPSGNRACLNHQKLALPADDVPCVFRN